MIRPSDVLTRAEIDELRQKNQWYAAFMVLHAWIVIGAAMALFAWWPNPLTFLVAVVLIGARQLGLAVLMHDGSHGLLFRNLKVNDCVSQWLCAFPVFSDLRPYRPYHMTHHRRTQQPDDPDLALSAPFPITRKSLVRKIIRDVTGQTGFKLRKSQIKNALGPSDMPAKERAKRFIDRLGGAIATNVVMFAVLAAAGYWWLYPTLWLLPLLTYQQLITRLRNISEHAMVPDNDDDFRNARTTRANWLARAIFAPYFVNYHVEHHLFVFIPCYNLPKAHDVLKAKGLADRIETKTSYFEVLKTAASKPNANDNEVAAHYRARRGESHDGFANTPQSTPRREDVA